MNPDGMGPPPHIPISAWTWVASPPGCQGDRGPAAHTCTWAPSEQTSPQPLAPQPCCPSSPLPHPIPCPPAAHGSDPLLDTSPCTAPPRLPPGNGPQTPVCWPCSIHHHPQARLADGPALRTCESPPRGQQPPAPAVSSSRGPCTSSGLSPGSQVPVPQGPQHLPPA